MKYRLAFRTLQAEEVCAPHSVILAYIFFMYMCAGISSRKDLQSGGKISHQSVTGAA